MLNKQVSNKHFDNVSNKHFDKDFWNVKSKY